MAVLYREWRPRDALPGWAHSLIQAGLVAALLYAFYNNGWAHTGRDIWPVLPMLALVLALSFDRGLLARALQSRIPQLLGVWSYAIYMGQIFWLLQAIRDFRAAALSPDGRPGAGDALFQPDLVAGAGASGSGLHRLGRAIGEVCRAAGCGGAETRLNNPK